MRFQTRLILLFAVLFATALILRLFFTWQFQKEQIAGVNYDLRNVVKVVHFATHKLASSSERDKEALTLFISEAVAQNKALKEISIINIHQEIVASSNPVKIGRTFSDTLREMMVEGELLEEDTVGLYEVAFPIMKDQKVIGQVQALIQLSDAAEIMGELHRKNILLTFILFCMVSLTSFFVIRRLTRPLHMLVSMAQQVAAGDLSVRLAEGGVDEHTQVAAAFNTMAEKLREQREIEERLRDLERQAILSETAATLAHEIRNPLNLINLTAGHLATRFLPEAPNQQGPFLRLIESLKEQVKHLNEMVKEFLAVGKPIKLQKSQFQLQELLEQVEVLSKQELSSRHVHLKTDVDPGLSVFADREQLRLVLLNLLLNAVEMSTAGGRITLQAQERNGRSVILVEDTGPGIPGEDLEKVFEPYFTRRSGGTGLGLTLARRIIEEHGGHITAGNRSGGGACFTIDLPCKEP